MTQTVPKAFFIRAYLRASSDEQDAQRARSTLDQFAHERGFSICNYYVENESGTRLQLLPGVIMSNVGSVKLKALKKLKQLASIEAVSPILRNMPPSIGFSPVVVLGASFKKL